MTQCMTTPLEKSKNNQEKGITRIESVAAVDHVAMHDAILKKKTQLLLLLLLFVAAVVAATVTQVDCCEHDDAMTRA
mgnify:CR=1 FL=1